MHVIFCSDLFCDVDNDIKNSRSPAPISGHKFQENLIIGLSGNRANLEILNTTPIRAYPDYDKILFCKKDFVFRDNKLGIHIPFVSLPLLNRITQMISLCFYIWKTLKRSKEKVMILVWSSNIYKLLPALLIRQQFQNVYLCNFVADVHGEFGPKNDDTILQKIKNEVAVLGDKIGRSADCYVYLTNDMRDAIQRYSQPYCIVEALYRVKPRMIPNAPAHAGGEKLIFYAGTVSLEYGMEHLLKAFALIDDKNFRLIIAGNGSGVEMIKKYCMQDSRISYLGVIPPSEVAKYQALATVLVSPRKSTEPFVKYSFPSKTVECLASGTPYVAHRLPCEPPEYADYIQYPDDESDEAMARKLEEICNLSEEERRKIGERSREFIAREKNPKVMCKRIVDMWRGMLGE